MKITKIILGLTIVTTAFANAQNVNLAHWDMVDGSTSFLASSVAEPNSLHCVEPANMTASLNGSYSTLDSEDGSANGANCFLAWNSSIGTNVVGFKITTDAAAVGSLSLFNFDIGNYTQPGDPDQYRVTVLKNGVQALQTAWAAISPGTGTGNPWSAGSDQNISLSGLGLSTLQGQSDMFEFQIEAQRADGVLTNGRFALDNVRISGDVHCIPEPSSALLTGLAVFGLTVRRRR